MHNSSIKKLERDFPLNVLGNGVPFYRFAFAYL